jgi:hypothetical protein
MRSSTLLLIISLLVAILGLARVIAFGPLQDATVATLIFWTCGPAVVWLLLFVVGLIVHGRRGLWLLVGAPFALLLPTLLLNFYVICGLGTQWFGPAECP